MPWIIINVRDERDADSPSVFSLQAEFETGDLNTTALNCHAVLDCAESLFGEFKA